MQIWEIDTVFANCRRTLRISLKAFFSFGNKVRRKIVSIFDDKLISNSVETFVCKVWHTPLLKFTMNRRNIFLECLLIIQMALDFLILVLHNYYFPGKFRCFFGKVFKLVKKEPFWFKSIKAWFIGHDFLFQISMQMSSFFLHKIKLAILLHLIEFSFSPLIFGFS